MIEREKEFGGSPSDIRDFLTEDVNLNKNPAELFFGPVKENIDLKLKFDGKESALKFNEYIVYEEAQVKIRYIVQWRKKEGRT